MNTTYTYVKSMGNNFRKVVPNKNFMTPTVVQYYSNGIFEVELSKGGDFDGGEMFGVTVVNIQDKKHLTELGKSFTNIDEAIKYIKKEL